MEFTFVDGGITAAQESFLTSKRQKRFWEKTKLQYKFS